MRKELISKKEPGLDDLGNSQTVQFAEDSKNRSTVRKACSKEKAKEEAGQPFASASEGSEYSFTQMIL